MGCELQYARVEMHVSLVDAVNGQLEPFADHQAFMQRLCDFVEKVFFESARSFQNTCWASQATFIARRYFWASNAPVSYRRCRYSSCLVNLYRRNARTSVACSLWRRCLLSPLSATCL